MDGGKKLLPKTAFFLHGSTCKDVFNRAYKGVYLLNCIGDIMAGIERLREALGHITVEASDNSGLFKVLVNGRQEVVGAEFNESFLRPENAGMLAGAVIAALNQAFAESRHAVQKELAKIAGSFGLGSFTDILGGSGVGTFD